MDVFDKCHLDQLVNTSPKFVFKEKGTAGKKWFFGLLYMKGSACIVWPFNATKIKGGKHPAGLTCFEPDTCLRARACSGDGLGPQALQG